jgi:catechol 2,3-dioxygenase-like lactoylglutathione lyase family enzyme
MDVRWHSVVVDSKDAPTLARWWAQVLGWKVGYESEEEVVIAPAEAFEEGASLSAHGPGLVFCPVPEQKSVKNRLHIDIAPPSQANQQQIVSELEAIGATRVDVGQDDSSVTWVVMADPEGNEFCVLRPRD